ncbi:hypothetical protein B4135_3526 [Caldibacillus debilis]|uniref:Uncharacterized protein n=1 Tax=Caldibacillus debilis TaxID=301148 RepID=A0A150LDD9_9BACI|nr:hypothetical protein B4135_3526 [Caldibacillus debilis]
MVLFYHPAHIIRNHSLREIPIPVKLSYHSITGLTRRLFCPSGQRPPSL